MGALERASFRNVDDDVVASVFEGDAHFVIGRFERCADDQRSRDGRGDPVEGVSVLVSPDELQPFGFLPLDKRGERHGSCVVHQVARVAPERFTAREIFAFNEKGKLHAAALDACFDGQGRRGAFLLGFRFCAARGAQRGGLECEDQEKDGCEGGQRCADGHCRSRGWMCSRGAFSGLFGRRAEEGEVQRVHGVFLRVGPCVGRLGAARRASDRTASIVASASQPRRKAMRNNGQSAPFVQGPRSA